jgi:hypothetical protein
MFFEKFLDEKFWQKFVNTGSTSVCESLHNKAFTKFVRKNVPHNVHTRTTESRFCACVLNFNEGLSGAISMTNNIKEMTDWPISSLTGDKLIKFGTTIPLRGYWSLELIFPDEKSA